MIDFTRSGRFAMQSSVRRRAGRAQTKALNESSENIGHGASCENPQPRMQVASRRSRIHPVSLRSNCGQPSSEIRKFSPKRSDLLLRRGRHCISDSRIGGAFILELGEMFAQLGWTVEALGSYIGHYSVSRNNDDYSTAESLVDSQTVSSENPWPR